MKIYFYSDLMADEQIASFNSQVVQKHKLNQQFQYFIDILERMAMHSTDNPDDADYFCVPLFLAGWQFENMDPENHKIISHYCKYLSRGRHLLIGTGDFGQRYQSKSEMQGHPTRANVNKYRWLDDRFSLLALESTADLHDQDLGFLPYMVEPMPAKASDQPRDLLCSFKGALGYSELAATHIRGEQLLSHKDLLKSEGIHIYAPHEQGAIAGLSSRELMQRSIFTLCPAGYGQWSFRWIEALNAGSIPVIMADDYVLPFGDRIAWDKYVLRVPERELARLPEHLASVNIEKIAAYQDAILRDQDLFSRENVLSMIDDVLSEKAGEASAHWAIPRMRSPSEMGIICIDITNKCDLSCSNCTRLLKNQDYFWEMTPENFRLAARSLADFPGVIAVIGGNPCMHSRFEEISRIFEEEIPDRHKRGIWTNNAFKHADLLEQKFGAFNLNPHGVERGIKSVKPIYDRMVGSGKFNGGYYDTSSEHAPLLVAGKDLFDPPTMWTKISNCDVNKNWSAAIIQNKGKLRAYFCEVAASFDLARNEDHGLPVTNGWWKARMDVFAKQVAKFCPGCGAPARMKGHMDFEEIDGYSTSNADIALKSQTQKNRNIVLVGKDDADQLGHRLTKYQANAQ